eukprot:m.134107 g.134107  ORF g.134107 m.134107 type:complete len:643 (+) comp14688_c0_seq2:77-2005(+)
MMFDNKFILLFTILFSVGLVTGQSETTKVLLNQLNSFVHVFERSVPIGQEKLQREKNSLTFQAFALSANTTELNTAAQQVARVLNAINNDIANFRVEATERIDALIEAKNILGAPFADALPVGSEASGDFGNVGVFLQNSIKSTFFVEVENRTSTQVRHPTLNTTARASFGAVCKLPSGQRNVQNKKLASLLLLNYISGENPSREEDIYDITFQMSLLDIPLADVDDVDCTGYDSNGGLIASNCTKIDGVDNDVFCGCASNDAYALAIIEEDRIINIPVLLGTIVSLCLLGLFAAFLAFFHKYFVYEKVVTIVLSIALMSCISLFAIGQETLEENECIAVGILLHYSQLILLMAILVTTMQRLSPSVVGYIDTPNTEQRFFKLFAPTTPGDNMKTDKKYSLSVAILLLLLLPGLVVLITGASDKNHYGEYNNYCWLVDDAVWALGVPAMLLLSTLAIMLIRLYGAQTVATTPEAKKETKIYLIGLSGFTILLFITWFPVMIVDMGEVAMQAVYCVFIVISCLWFVGFNLFNDEEFKTFCKPVESQRSYDLQEPLSSPQGGTPDGHTTGDLIQCEGPDYLILTSPKPNKTQENTLEKTQENESSTDPEHTEAPQEKTNGILKQNLQEEEDDDDVIIYETKRMR